MLGSCKAELCQWVSTTPTLSWRSEPRYLIGPTLTAKLAEEGAVGWSTRGRWQPEKFLAGRRGCLQWTGWTQTAKCRWRKVRGLRAINKAPGEPDLAGDKDIFAVAGQGCWLQHWAGRRDQQAPPEYPSDIAETGLASPVAPPNCPGAATTTSWPTNWPKTALSQPPLFSGFPAQPGGAGLLPETYAAHPPGTELIILSF